MRTFSGPGAPCVFHAVGDRLCRLYQISDRLWRWELLRPKGGPGFFGLERVGCRPSFSLALAVACSHVQTARPRPSRRG
jgi:hypothetical protein